MAVKTLDARVDIRAVTDLERVLPLACAQVPSAPAPVFSSDVHVVGIKLANLVDAPAAREVSRRRSRR